MREIFENKILRRNFWAVVISVLIFLTLVRYFIGDTINNFYLDVLASVVESLFATFITTAFVGGFLFYMSPATVKKNKINVLDPREISSKVEAALSKATSWKFKGGYGHYFRTAILSKLSNNALDKQISINVTGQIVDPRDSNLCSVHAESRRNREKGNKCNLEQIRMQCFATIIISFIRQYQNSLLKISIFLTKQYSPRRIDISSDSIFITWGEKYAPALYSKKGSHFYSSHDKEIHYTSIQSYQVDLNKGIKEINRKKISIDMISPDTVITILKSIDLYDKDLLLKKDIIYICDIVNKDKNPYG